MEDRSSRPGDFGRYPSSAMCDTSNPKRVSFLVLVVVTLFVGCTESSRTPRIVGETEWPPAMRDLFARYTEISKSITTYKHDAFVDTKFTLKIVDQGDEIERLIVDLNLQPTTANHVKFRELELSIPDTWDLPISAEAKVYASEGYGVEHQEGTDLLLLVQNPKTDETIVLYEWIF